MKRILILCAFVMTAGIVSAQKACTSAEKAACAKKCTAAEKAACAKKGLKTSEATVATDVLESDASDSNVMSAMAAADILAEADENIQRKECAMSGNVSYYKKNVCSKSGKVSMDEVKYCTDSKAFVNASPSKVMSDAKAKVIKTADTVDGKVQSTKSTKKACCKGKKKCSSKKTGV